MALPSPVSLPDFERGKFVEAADVTGLPAVAVVNPDGSSISGSGAEPSTVAIDQTTPGTTNGVEVNAALPAGTNNIGDVDIASIAAGSNIIGNIRIDQTTPGTTNNITIKPITTGGLTTFHLISAATTNATVVKASAGQLYGYYIYNANAAMRKVAFHNTASAPTAGASIFFSLPIPPTSGANVEFTQGVAFSTGIAITTVTEIADSGTTAVGSGDLAINLFYA